jgi:hypothetical protein
MLPTDNEYDIYLAGGSPAYQERPRARRQSWPKATAAGAATANANDKRFSPRRAVGRALIGLGQIIAAEPGSRPEPRIATSAR